MRTRVCDARSSIMPAQSAMMAYKYEISHQFLRPVFHQRCALRRTLCPASRLCLCASYLSVFRSVSLSLCGPHALRVRARSFRQLRADVVSPPPRALATNAVLVAPLREDDLFACAADA